MIDYMLPTFKTVFEEIGKTNFMTQGNMNGLSTYDLQTAPIQNLNITNSHIFNWNEFYFYNTLSGLHDTDVYKNEIENNPEKKELSKAYIYLGDTYLKNDCN